MEQLDAYARPGGGGRLGSGGGLPPDVLAVLPRDGAAQLALSHAIAAHAYGQQAARLEGENRQLAADLDAAAAHAESLERRLGAAEAEAADAQARARAALGEQHKLVAEKSALIETVRRLNREVARLEHFKRNLLQTLQDEEESDSAGGFAPSLAAVDLTTERLVSEVLHSADGIAAAAAAAAAAAGAQQAQTQQKQQQQQQQPQQQQQRLGSRVSPAKPGALSAAGSAASRALVAGAVRGPAQPYARVRASPASPCQGAACTPGRLSGSGSGGGVPASSPRVDGKEFFRQARARLSYEQFSQFLVAIKELNGGRASREDTLGAARGLFGAGNADLYGLFEQLLMRHLAV
ncbi:hypothetical protein HT031_000138 [Scenedesmus sp. PABB004]|nr:hypothetical protein HT031_000138 [Scenedesmus sp. PABB004]